MGDNTVPYEDVSIAYQFLGSAEGIPDWEPWTAAKPATMLLNIESTLSN